MIGALCVECDAELNIGERARLGQRVICPNCGVELEVISIRPLEVDIALDEGGEWDDLDGYSIEDEMDVDDLEDYGRLDGYEEIDLDEEDTFGSWGEDDEDALDGPLRL